MFLCYNTLYKSIFSVLVILTQAVTYANSLSGANKFAT